MTYRKDIDFLRALAAFGVFFYHLSIPGLDGGFIFLDIFFVITGFLISTIIMSKAMAGEFQLKAFYINRIFRLMPALLVTILVTLLAGLLILTPEHLKNLSGSAIAASLSVSNFYFWAQVDYFDIDKYLKPLLHTWSLGVEDQFYLFWPIALIFLVKAKNKLRAYYALLFILFGVSLFTSIVWSYSEAMRAGAYYLLPSRAFEFIIGAVIASIGPLAIVTKRLKPFISNVLFIAGLACIFWSAFFFTEEAPFPSWRALIPCLGAMLCLVSGEKSSIAGWLSNRVTVFLGQISYSLYLVHFPIIVFYGYERETLLGFMETVFVIIFAVAIATLLHIFIEQPFRQRPSPFSSFTYLRLNTQKRKLGLISLFAVTLISAIYIHQTNGMRYRLNTDIQGALEAAQNDYDRRQDFIRAPKCHYNDTKESYSDYLARFESCNPPEVLDQSKQNILLIGDSHGADIYSAFSELRPNVNVIQLTKAGCYIEYNYGPGNYNCGQVLSFAATYLRENAEDIDAVIFKIRGHILYELDGPEFKSLRQFLIDPAQSFLEELSRAGAPVIWLGPNVEFAEDYRDIIQKSKSVTEGLETAEKGRRWKELDALDADLIDRFSTSPVTYISSREICGGPCPMLTNDGIPVTPDYGHWGVSGAAFMGEYVLSAPPIAKLLDD